MLRSILRCLLLAGRFIVLHPDVPELRTTLVPSLCGKISLTQTHIQRTHGDV